MRAVQRAPRTGVAAPTERPGSAVRGQWSRTGMALAALALLAYLCGVVCGRLYAPELATTVADRCLEKQSYSAFMPVLLRLLAAGFFQLTAIAFLGLHVFGAALPAAFIGLQGLLCGLCAAGVTNSGGTKALVIYWLISCLPVITNFLLMLWLGCAASRAGRLLLGIACNTAPRGISIQRATNLLMLRYLFSLAGMLGGSLFGALLGVFFASVLL